MKTIWVGGRFGEPTELLASLLGLDVRVPKRRRGSFWIGGVTGDVQDSYDRGYSSTKCLWGDGEREEEK